MKKTIISLLSFILFVYLFHIYLELEIYYSIGIGILLLFHELGHVIALRKTEGKLNGIYFLPFIGAMVIGNKKIKTENEYAKINFFGPLMGFISLLLLFILYLIVKKTLLLNFIFIGSFINLINLIPITLLDGYGILRGSIKHIKWLGFFIIIFLIGYMLEGYMFTLCFIMIFFLISDSPEVKDTGFKIWEAIIAISSIMAMVFITIKEKENIMPNLAILTLSFFIFFAYIKETLFNKNKEEHKIELLTPLTKKQKILWITSYVLLSGSLFVFLSIQKIF